MCWWWGDAVAQMVLPDSGPAAPWDKSFAYRCSTVEVFYQEAATTALDKELALLPLGDPRLAKAAEAAQEDRSKTPVRLACLLVVSRFRGCL